MNGGQKDDVSEWWGAVGNCGDASFTFGSSEESPCKNIGLASLAPSVVPLPPSLGKVENHLNCPCPHIFPKILFYPNSLGKPQVGCLMVYNTVIPSPSDST